MAPDDLTMACRLSGLSAADLWQRYVELGGNRPRRELEARLGGAAWHEADERYLAVVADEALRDLGLRLLPEAAAPAEDAPVDAGVADWSRTAILIRETRARTSRLTTLFERCSRARADSNEVREQLEGVLRTVGARGGPDVWGGR